MVIEAQKTLCCRSSYRALIITIIVVCVIIGIGVGIFFFVKNKNSSESDQYDDYDNELMALAPQTSKWIENEEIRTFRKYLRFQTISLESNFGPCVEFLKEQAHALDLDVSVHFPANQQNPVVLMTWHGSQPELPSILLNSHMDVVPVVEEFWEHPPFEAQMDESGNIHARGAQDMKSIGMQYLAAIRALKRKGVDQLKRTIHLTYVPDEEVGGHFGMDEFVKTDVFKNLNIGCALDEGYPSETNNLEVFNTEKSSWGINITAHSHSGHSSLLFNDTAVEKLNYVMDKFLELRRNESERFYGSNLPYGNVTTINITILKGGFKVNVVPPEMSAYIDMRLAMDTDWDELERMIKQWIKEAGVDISMNISKSSKPMITSIDSSNHFWTAFKIASEQLHLNVTPAVFRAGTDSRYIRGLKIPAFGFSPLMNTRPMLHEHNEYINADIYLKGIEIYETIIQTLANVD